MGHTILLADDSVTVRRIVELAFRDTEIRVEAVGSGREAVERWNEGRPDLVLADVLMPPPTGYDLCRSIKQSERPVPVLLLRNAFEPFDEQRASACGADGEVAKPFESGRLVDRVRELLVPPAPSVDAPRHPEFPRADRPAERSVDEVAAALDELAEPTQRAAPHDEGSAAVEPVGDADGGRGTVAELPPRPDETERAHVLRVEAGDEDRTALRVDVREPAEAPNPPVSDGREAVPVLDDDALDALADRVVRRLGDRVVREIAWEVVPDLAAAMIRERLRQLEQDDDPGP